jgi:hypothetical protein
VSAVTALCFGQNGEHVHDFAARVLALGGVGGFVGEDVPIRDGAAVDEDQAADQRQFAQVVVGDDGEPPAAVIQRRRLDFDLLRGVELPASTAWRRISSGVNVSAYEGAIRAMCVERSPLSGCGLRGLDGFSIVSSPK